MIEILYSRPLGNCSSEASSSIISFVFTGVVAEVEAEAAILTCVDHFRFNLISYKKRKKKYFELDT